MKKVKVSQKAKRKAKPLFLHLLEYGRREPFALPSDRIVKSDDGVSALEWYVASESGHNLPTRHPRICDRVKIGRSLKGVTKTMWAEDLSLGLITCAEVREWAFDEADAKDVINRS